MFVPHPSLIIIIYWVISEISKYISVYVIRITDYRSENHRCHLYFCRFPKTLHCIPVSYSHDFYQRFITMSSTESESE